MARWEFRIRFLLLFCSLEASAQVVPSSLDFGLSRKPGSACTFNPCNIPNFCGNGRTCKIDNNCISRCSCIDDSTHPKCTSNSEDGQSLVQNTFSTGKTESTDSIKGTFASNKQSNSNTDPLTSDTSIETKCNVDPCRTMSWLCDGNRKCVTRDCILHCECTQDSTHSSCVSDRQTETNETEDCGGFPGMRCVHGECVQIEDAFSCQCDENWTGPLCDQHASTGCTRQCEYGYECSWYMNTLQICKPKQTTTTIHNSMSENSTSLFLPLNACLAGYVLRPETQRNCSSGLTCQYGVCQENENRSSVCLCDDGAFGPTCNKTCCKDCGVGGECLLVTGGNNDDVHETCRCYPNYSGETCSEMPGTDSGIPWYIWLIITCILVLVLLLALFVIVPYILWKRRVIPIMKFVHHFQGYEDQDGREWDVFLSCPPQAQSFVAQILLPKLEDELRLKTLIHYRGISLDNSVSEAMQNSRRLLYVVTPDNVHPDGPGFESSAVVAEMLRHKHRVISIIFDSISGEPRNPKSRIGSQFKTINPLVWPGWNSEDQLQRFWTRLELCLPKKRARTRQARSENGRQRNGKISSHSSTETRNGHQQMGQNGHSVAHIRTEYETDHYHKINGMSRL